MARSRNRWITFLWWLPLASKVVEVYFNEPIEEEIKPLQPVRPTSFSYQDVQVLARRLRAEGWDERAIVSLRREFPHSGLPNWYEMGRPQNWGIVMDLRTTVVAPTGTPYKPIKVRWVSDGSITDHWPEELVLIHEALSFFETEQKLKELY